jgi:endogenous inhibitor of DNA gyrase (YacG/DUF329 family)
MIKRQSFLKQVTVCPSCQKEVAFARLTGMSGPHVHFYANDSNDVLLRAAWFEEVSKALKSKEESEIRGLIATLLETIPNGSSKYSVSSNVKCPHCLKEFSYRYKNNLKLRLEDPVVVLIDQCRLDTDHGMFDVVFDE